MKLPFKDIEPFVKKMPPHILAVLIYGPDEGLARERLNILTRQVVADIQDPFNIAEFTGDQLSDQPSKLIDEAQSISMLGGRRVVRLRGASDSISGIVKETLSQLKPGDNLVLVEAGELPPRSSLRDLFERAENAAALPCYVDDARDISRILADSLKAEGFSIPSDALQYMAANVVGDRGVARGEAEKLATYMGAEKNIRLEDVIATVGSSAALSLDDLSKSVFSGQFAEADRVIRFLLNEGTEPVRILRSLQNHLTRLYLTRLRADKGDNIEAAMKKLRPEVFWKNKASFESQVNAFTAAALEQAQNLLTGAEGKCKQTGSDPQLICSRIVLSLSQMASRMMSGRRRA